MAGGGTGGHVIPALAVAEELRRRGHQALFIGVKTGIEARLVPQAGYPIEWIEIQGIQRRGIARTAEALWQLPAAVLRSRRLLREHHAAAVFSMGGYAAGPVVLAAALARVPIVAMEPNAMPGLVTRKMARWYHKALVSFPETIRYFPPRVAEISGLPVRKAFFEIPPCPPGEKLVVLVTGGSRGARALNRAARESWPFFREAASPVVWIVQAGRDEEPSMQRAFAETGLAGKVTAFIEDMPAAFAAVDIIVGRAGAGNVSELAAAGKPSVLVPFPYAADDHQTRNAEAMQRAGAARMIPENDFNGRRLFDLIEELRRTPGKLTAMGQAARAMAHPGAAKRAADALEEAAQNALT